MERILLRLPVTTQAALSMLRSICVSFCLLSTDLEYADPFLGGHADGLERQDANTVPFDAERVEDGSRVGVEHAVYFAVDGRLTNTTTLAAVEGCFLCVVACYDKST